MIEQARETRIAAARAQLRQALGEMAKAERAVHGAASTDSGGRKSSALRDTPEREASAKRAG
jgi:hypothetical protein